ncbi:acyl-CoA dehydrogenase family protein [Pedobacter sp. CFBP9032]|uniref:acyl-CoA dehydrogenase family protein n=1 Tax=Pedobacter sp. CFBP9032 TaxID=3096539 RepID=UPI002A6A0960|nr:acyl-CoA dehydrogenase family protein [Pedobacter sp. CFBP9032]MDY0907067.1 acyl-CoA dehydrogenase family protein [Pedobacter sp. CFBP9032]
MNNFNQEFPEFLKNFEQNLKHLFQEKHDIDQLSLQRGLPPELLKEIMDHVPLSVAIPSAFGGRGSKVKECLGILSAASYESLSLSLTFGINIALFLEPVAKYGNEEIKQGIFDRFLHEQNMGGLMITEPNFGSDALNMRTTNVATEEGYKIKGTKHWQGLTGMANYWIVATRNEGNDASLSRDIDFFVCDDTKPDQKITVEEYYDNAGLYLIPYGLNQLDLNVPKNHKLQPETTGIKMMLDILHRSRMQFPGMGMGFIKRMLDEAYNQCNNRKVGIGNLLGMDNVKFQISRLQAAYTICSAMCAKSSSISGIENNLATEGLEANTMKTVVTDFMQEAAQLLVQLSGAKGYRTTHIGGRGIMDSRPFQIFEGSNEMLYAQIGEMIIKAMKKQKQPQLYQYLKDFPLTSKATDHFKQELSFNPDEQLSQRKMVDLGRIVARIICVGYVIELGEKGFRKELVANCIIMLQQEVASLITSLRFNNAVIEVSDYHMDSLWLDFA